MKAKKIAVRGIVALAALVALCIFFSGTIRTIATAKVKFTQPRSGKLTQTVELTGKLVFTTDEDIYLPGGANVTIDVKTVNVEVGFEVEEGDELFTGEVSGYESTMRQYRESYAQDQTALEALEEKNIRLKRTDEQWASAYDALQTARDAHMDADLQYRARLKVAGIEDAGERPEDEELAALYDKRAEAAAALETAQADMDAANRYSISDETRNYLTERSRLTRSMEKTEAEMLELAVINESVKSVTASTDGFITELNVKPGESFSVSGPAYSICPEDELPVVRVDITDCPLTLTKGMNAILIGATGENVESEIENTGVTLSGGRYADLELKKKRIDDMGGIYAMMTNGVSVRVEYRSKNVTTLLPAAAVRGSENERYVYTTRQKESAFGTRQTVTVRQDVTVVAEADGIVSVEEDITYLQVVYMEDRSISEGDAVMEYLD